MGTLSYSTAVSLDGYVADASGDFQWSAPSEEIFAFHVERMAAVSTEVLGRKTYELMTYWNAVPSDDSWGPLEHEFSRRWQGIEHIVASKTMGTDDLDSEQDRLVQDLSLDVLEQIVQSAPGEVEIFGPTTASAAIRAGMVKEFSLFVVPKMIGGGLAAIPEGASLNLRLTQQRVFENGTAYLHYVAA